jgi:hypothetical protein
LAKTALFQGLVIDENDQAVAVSIVGDEAFYVVDDEGFLRHVESEKVDRQVLQHLASLIEGQEELVSEGAMKMLGQEDIFTKAVIENSLRNIDERFDEVIDQGLPDEARTWFGMMGFRIVINIHGEVIHVEQPGAVDDQ